MSEGEGFKFSPESLWAIVLVLLAILVMASLHEKHYRQRRTIIDPTKGIEDRISAIEAILTEDRFT